jgi:hypothetical protein
MKKTSSLLAVAALCFLFASGCGKAPPSGEAAGGAAPVAPLVRLTPEQEAKAAADAFIASFRAGRLDEILLSLPESYQADVSRVVRAYAEKIDATLFARGTELLSTLADVLDAQADNLAGLLSAPGEGLWDLADGMDVRPEVSAGDIRSTARWLGNAVRKLDYGEVAAGNILPLLEMAPLREVVESALAQCGFGAVSSFEIPPDDGTPRAEGIVKLAFSYPVDGEDKAESDELEFVKVEGRWVPLELSRAWGDAIGVALEGIDALTVDEETVERMNRLLPVVQRALASLKDAQSAQELQAQAMGAAMTIGMMLQ